MLIKKKIFDELDGFDEKFFVSLEDVDIGWRACIYGYKVVVVPKSKVFHYVSGTVSPMIEAIKFHWAKNTLVLRLTNFETPNVFRSMSVSFFKTLMKKTLRIFSVMSNPKEPLPKLLSFKILLKAIGWALKNLSYVHKKRKKVSRFRINSTQKLIKLKLILNARLDDT